MIKIKSKQILKDLKGEKVLKNEEGKDLTIGEVISNVLSAKPSNPYLGYQLAKKFATKDEVELKLEDANFIKKELEENCKSKEFGYYAMAIGPCIDMLEGIKETDK